MKGKHLIVDLSNCEERLLRCEKLLKEFLNDLVKSTGLTAVSRPTIIAFDPQGHTGFVVLAESHASFHTYPELGKIFIDVFSCRDFPHNGLVNLCSFTFLAGETRVEVIERN